MFASKASAYGLINPGIPKHSLAFGVEMPFVSRSTSSRVLFLAQVGDSDGAVMS
jgi:hypothetical protein